LSRGKEGCLSSIVTEHGNSKASGMKSLQDEAATSSFLLGNKICPPDHPRGAQASSCLKFLGGRCSNPITSILKERICSSLLGAGDSLGSAPNLRNNFPISIHCGLFGSRPNSDRTFCHGYESGEDPFPWFGSIPASSNKLTSVGLGC
jgi:hypothetical protein